MKLMILLVALLTLTTSVFAESISSTVKIEQISVDAGNGNTLIRTKPPHSISSTNCQNNYWLTLSKSMEGYEAMLSMLLAAQVTQKDVLVFAEDHNASPQFCALSRLVTLN